jgi:hypothetical protein
MKFIVYFVSHCSLGEFMFIKEHDHMVSQIICFTWINSKCTYVFVYFLASSYILAEGSKM